MTVLPFPLVWAEQLIRNGRDVGLVPTYGSADWLALPDDDRRKVAACVIAAEAHRTRTESPGTGRQARRLAQARRSRPGDHLGGPVSWASDV